MSVQRIQQHFRDSAALALETMESLSAPLAAAIDTLFSAVANGNKILTCGNGGSAAGAQHLAAELMGRFERERPGLPALALTADSAVLTWLGDNDTFAEIFAKQVRALGQPGDILLAFSATGSSANVLAAIAQAQEREMIVIAVTGRNSGSMKEAMTERDIHIEVPSERTARIDEMHLLIAHCLCDGIDAMLLGDD